MGPDQQVRPIPKTPPTSRGGSRGPLPGRGWDLNTLQLKKEGLANGEALASRLRKHLQDLLQIHPDLVVNPQSYGMHSLRRGGVLAAWQAGVDTEKIRAHGRWKSDAVRAYMTAERDIKLAVTLVM